MYITTTGLVLRETRYKETSRILTVLSPTEGKITVTAKGAVRKNSATAAGSQFLAYSEMTLFKRSDYWTLTDARCLEEFKGLREDVALLALGGYFAEVLEVIAVENEPDRELVSIGLNGLFALSEGKRNRKLVKSVFELRMACSTGFTPDLDYCNECGTEASEPFYLDLSGGVLKCSSCVGLISGNEAELSASVLQAMRFICSASSKKVYDFSLNDVSTASLAAVCEKYFLTQLDRNFRSLDFYHSMESISEI